ncbi:MAG: hypothetical protein EAZ97_04405 [Bacteroidetes bacterium]|nr:MAG: hypothetical protein EAZ97_04405 [Bacteroidota bacterium]
MAKISDDLKLAILEMPDKEKNKLLLRLIAKDFMLIAQLQHQLLEGEEDMKNKRSELLAHIQKYLGTENNNSYSDTPGLLMMEMRDMNGNITRHVKITKDKLGEIELTLCLVNHAFAEHPNMLAQKAKRAENFAEYVVKKADFVLKKLEKIHEDYHIVFEDDTNKMLQFIANYQPCQPFAKSMNLPRYWRK